MPLRNRITSDLSLRYLISKVSAKLGRPLPSNLSVVDAMQIVDTLGLTVLFNENRTVTVTNGNPNAPGENTAINTVGYSYKKAGAWHDALTLAVLRTAAHKQSGSNKILSEDKISGNTTGDT